MGVFLLESNSPTSATNIYNKKVDKSECKDGSMLYLPTISDILNHTQNGIFDLEFCNLIIS